MGIGIGIGLEKSKMNISNVLTDIVPAVVQKQTYEWQEIIDRIAKIAVDEDKGALSMGDLFLEVEEKFGRKYVKKAVAATGVSWSKARQRLAVSKKIPKGHFLRNSPLSFCHLRAIVATDNMEYWANKALENQWGIEKLREEIESKGDETAIESETAICIECEQSITSLETMISFNRHRQRKSRLCSPKCAVKYFDTLEEDNENVEVHIDNLPTIGLDIPNINGTTYLKFSPKISNAGNESFLEEVDNQYSFSF